jgi:hypothetical protein
MKDIIEKILAYLPQYFAELGRLFAAPKRFIAERDVNSDETFAASLLFLAISLVLSMLISQLFLRNDKDLWTELGRAAVVTMIDVTTGALAIYFAWWIVGSRARAKGFFTSFSYFSGALYVILAALDQLPISVIKIFEPEVFEKMLAPRSGLERFRLILDPQLRTQVFGEPTTALYVANVIDWAGTVLFFVWVIVAWGAFRKLSGLSKIRSFFAFLLACVFSVIGMITVTLVSFALD